MHGTVSRTCKKKKTVLTIRSQKEIVSWRTGRRRKRGKEEGRRKRRRNINNNYICTLLCVYLEHVKNRRQVRTKYFRI